MTTVEGADVEYGVKIEDKADGTYALVMRCVLSLRITIPVHLAVSIVKN